MKEEAIGSEYGIVPFAFGAPAEIWSNMIIAEIALEEALKYKSEIYTQSDIRIASPEIDVEYIDEEPGSPPSSLQIARSAVKWALRNDHNEIMVVAAPPQLARCLRDLEYAIKEVGVRIGVYCSNEVDAYSYEDWFCADSTQPRTQSKEKWEKRERILQRLPMWLYKVVV
jgi:hypothetical protein